MKSRYRIKKTKNCIFHNTLVATVFLANGFFLVSPVLAQTTPTAAGSTIDNQATATYEDPNNPNVPINSTSNTVTVTVAEVAGISVVAGTPEDDNGGSIQTGDIIYFPFTITNVGNDPTKFQIPTQAGITGPGTQGTLQYSTDSGASWTNVPNGGFTTSSIAVNGTILVRVPVTVNSGATSGQTIKVTLGETNPAETATNSPRSGSINDARDIYTVDNDNSDGISGEITGSPVNGVVEGSASASITINPKNYSLATIFKTRGTYNNQNTLGDITDDTINYNLSLQVRSTDNTGQNITPSALAGSDVPGLSGKNILVADAIPLGTQLAVSPTAPSGWTVVYSTSLPSTPANSATWTTSAPNLSQVTRVGFIKPTTDGNSATYLAAADAQLTQFSIQVKVKAGETPPLTIANIAQVFGKTPGTDAPVFDESGDQNPSNFNGISGNMTPPSNTDTNGDGVPDQLPPTVPDGYIDNSNDLAATGTDTAGNNTGDTENTTANSGGEANVFTIDVILLLNGPNGSPEAVGPSNNNDDFTNKSSDVPTGLTPGSTFDPDPVTFTNTIKNTGNQPKNISLLPTLPANPDDLPNGTVVTISANGGISATYTYNNGVFTFTSGAGSVGGNLISGTNPIRIDGVAANGTANYSVTVDLPTDTPLSTDPGIERGFPVPITAFIDTDGDGLAVDERATNITINRVYTGFLQLIKQSRVLKGTGPAVQGTDGTLSTTAKKPAPGNIIEYVIQYKNISEPPPGSGSNNVILNADKVVITEDGTVIPNNWAQDNDSNGAIDTSHVAGSAQDSGGTITFFSGNPATTNATNTTSGTSVTTDVTKYVDTVNSSVAPGVTRTFTFQRKVN
ncbi:hypothetical protein IQ244_30295 [Nostoc sp. LEGE 06077]|uniref:beta strand repeat-containing protein n=1 Tax=Nostoc sp. LEGE 06077 TaxID=915325 RepID=UPI001881C72D|nr:hypothetical protein [Nostoc sp. LEGE 06077]MBE9210718.1 hypothetical protein [Nostoc sp. LEGE 06077]